MNFKSKTFYLAVNYLDIIFSKQKNISYNYNFIAAACLITASKFCENVPLKPTFQRFINLFNNETNNNENKITKEDLFLYEIIICKILDYKLNYFTIYEFNFFFFGNGILKSEHLKEINNSIEIGNPLIKNLLMKIYEKSKQYLNVIINNLICLKYNSLLISICIMEKSIDYVLIKEFKREDSFNIDDIKRKNKKYFWEIIKEFYKIEYEFLEDYQYLKLDCEKYKIFDDNSNNININQDIDLNKSTYSLFTNNFFNKLNTKICSSKSITKNKQQPNGNEESFQSKKYNKNRNKFLYKKVNITFYENKKNNIENNKIQTEKKDSPNRIMDNKDSSNINKNYNINTNSKRTAFEFYQNDKNHFRNSVSSNKDNYFLTKFNTSSSKFKNSLDKKVKFKENNNIKRIDSVDSNSNSFDEKKEINNLLIKKENINLIKPYRKKIIYNQDKILHKNNKANKQINNNTNNNININININNRILYEDISKSKYRGRSSNKIIISKYINNEHDNSPIRKKINIKYKSRAKRIEKNHEYNFESSPVYKRNISKSKNNVSFKNNLNNDNNNKNNLNSFNIKEKENNSKKLNFKISQLNDINYNSIQNSSLTSRNSFQYQKHNIKLTDSFVKIQMNYFNGDNNKNISSSRYLDDKDNIIKNNHNYNLLNDNNKFKPNENPNNIRSSTIVNNNYNKYQNNINNNFNINFNYINEKI